MSKGMDQLSRRLHQFTLPGLAGAGLLGIRIMANYRVTNELSAVDAAYIAGLIDGEGTITLTRKHRKDYRRLAITISSTERQLLEFVQNKCGVGNITNKITYNPSHADSYAYAVYNRQALSLLEQIEPYLLSYKAQRAEVILRDYMKVITRNGKYSKEQLDARTRFEQLVLKIKANTIKEPTPAYC